MKRLFDGALLGTGFVAVAFAIAYAGDIFTIDKDGTTKFAVSDAGKITVGATESYVNLVVQNDGTTPNSQVNITADVLTVEGIRLENINVSADITVSGAGGLDAGSEAAGTWFYVWVVTNNTGTSANGLLSTSSTAPILPSGFTKKRRVGAVRNDASSNFLRFVQEGNMCNYLDGNGNNRILTAGIATNWTTISMLSSYLPATSRRAKLRALTSVVHDTANVAFRSQLKKTGIAVVDSQLKSQAISQVASVQNQVENVGDVDTDDSQQVDYKFSSPAPSSSGGLYIDVLGYYDRI